MNDFLAYSTLGLLQGLTEFLPVSSSGHLVVAHELLGITQNGLAVDAVLQLATVLAVLAYFAKDLLRLAYTFLYWITGRPTKPEDRTPLVAIVVGTVPAVILGLLLESTMETLFRSADLVAYALIVGSAILFFAEFLSRKNVLPKPITAGKGFLIGLFQSLALVPGMSRSGMTIAGGLFLGMNREQAARFGFLLSVPIILGSGLKKLIELWGGGELAAVGTPLLVGSVVAFISGFAAIHVLLMFVRRQPLYIFVVYRLMLAGVILFFL